MPEQRNLSGPHIQVAALCEKVLIENDGAFSLIRIIDRFNISAPTPEMPPNNIAFTILVAFKAGFYRGKGSIKVGILSPTGKELPALSFSLLFEGDDDRGVLVQANLTMLITEEGVYWFDVSLEGAHITRIPLRVVYQQIGSAMQGRA